MISIQEQLVPKGTSTILVSVQHGRKVLMERLYKRDQIIGDIDMICTPPSLINMVEIHLISDKGKKEVFIGDKEDIAKIMGHEPIRIVLVTRHLGISKDTQDFKQRMKMENMSFLQYLLYGPAQNATT